MTTTESEIAMQSGLFELPKPEMPTCPHGGQPSSVQGSPDDCLTCNHDAIGRFMRWYASHGKPGGKKKPGMAFPSGSLNPTPEDRAWAHQLLDQLEQGDPR